MKTNILCIALLCLAMLLQLRGIATAQIPVEIFVGHERTTLDIMFFKFFLNDDNSHTPWLFFNRTRAGLDYRLTDTSYFPQFGFTEAFSYNHPSLNGFAPVGVVQILNRGIFPKVGIQYANISTDATLFSWVVVETRQRPAIDVFLLARFTPKITDIWRLFTQIELINALPTEGQALFSFIQRGRVGVQYRSFQWGVGADITLTGKSAFAHTANIGLFVRHEF